jgi:hypothetical protein
MTISYAKLRSGEWGVRSDQLIREGETVTVTTKAGQAKPETIKKIVWTDGKVWLAAVETQDTPPARERENGPRECADCGERAAPGSQCQETGRIH